MKNIIIQDLAVKDTRQVIASHKLNAITVLISLVWLMNGFSVPCFGLMD